MHIVILSDRLPPDHLGGAERIAWQLGQGLIAAGQRVTFITATEGPARVETRQGITVHLLHSHYAPRWRAWYSLLNPQTVMPLNRLLRQLKPDIIHAHNIHTDLSYHSLVIGHFVAKVTVLTAHDAMPFAYTKIDYFIDPARLDQVEGWDYRLPLGHNIRRMHLRWNPARNLSIRHTMHYYVDGRIAVSHALKTALEANTLPPFEVIHNGVDPAFFDVPAVGIDVLRQRFKLGGRRVIVFSGRLSRQKGDQQLLAALRRVKAAVPNVALLVLSRASSYADALIRQNPDLADTIVTGGWLEGAELATAYRLADVLASPSVYFDPFPTVNLEGMAAGAVPVTTCFGGSREVVVDGETGFVVNPFDTEALADRLIRLLSDETLRGRMAEAGRQRIAEGFTLRHQTENTLAVYERILAKKRK